MIRLVLADDNRSIREGVGSLWEGSPDVEVVASCEDRDSVLRAVEELEPDVVLTDVRMPPANTVEGMEIADRLARTHPAVGVVVVGQSVEPGYALRLFAGGTRGRAYLLKDRLSDRSRLECVVSMVAGGGSLVDPKIVDELLTGHTADPARTGLLTERGRVLLRLVVSGKTDAAIAAELSTDVHEVERDVAELFATLGLPGEADAGSRLVTALAFLAGAQI